MSKYWTLCLVAVAALFTALPAFAEDSQDDWLRKTFSHHRESLSSDRSESRRGASDDDQGTYRTRSTRVAQSDDSEDDGSRPQRRAAAKPRPRESLSGGSGETGVASYYWEPQALASGGRFNPNAMTAAHKTLPFGTRVRVTRLDNGNSVEVTINDRGPYVGGRIIDLSKRAAQEIGMTGAGVARVRVAILGR